MGLFVPNFGTEITEHDVIRRGTYSLSGLSQNWFLTSPSFSSIGVRMLTSHILKNVALIRSVYNLLCIGLKTITCALKSLSTRNATPNSHFPDTFPPLKIACRVMPILSQPFQFVFWTATYPELVLVRMLQ